ncbi:MAG: hypothetical protein M3Z09_06410 [Acidobacteriota bacterium]|nr:hypothetical protein [Acidobacteriota bacterium]
MRGIAAVAVLLVCAGCRNRPETAAELLRRLPAEDATLVGIDVDALRRGGILKLLELSKQAAEPEYLAFLNGTGFDYQRDLDLVLASFTPAGAFMVLRGRFDWPKLEAYAKGNGGSCYNKLCRMPGSVPERRISFLPVSNTVMALAVSTDDLAASRITKPGPARLAEVPAQPVWLNVPGSVLRKSSILPPATRIFAAALGASDQVTATLGPAPDGGYEAKLTANCRTAEDAHRISAQMTSLTGMLKSLVGRSKKEDLASVLAAGAFSQTGTNMNGYWTVPKGLLESLAQ